MTVSALALAALAVAGGGCQNSSSGGSESGPSVGAAPVAKPVPTNYTVLRRSSRAFTFLVAQGGTITLQDLTADRTVLSTQIPPQTLVRVDPKAGVFTGTTQVVKGPLPEKNERELRLKK